MSEFERSDFSFASSSRQQDFADERGFAGAADAGDADEPAQRDFDG